MNIMRIAFNPHESVDKSMQQPGGSSRRVAALFVIAMLCSLSFSKNAFTSDFQTLAPTANGTTQAWTVVGAATAWQAVTSADADTSYITYSAGAGGKSTFALADLTGSGGIINSVTVNAACRDAAGPEEVAMVVRTGGADYFVVAAPALTTTFADFANTWLTNPQTLVAWTWAEVQALEAGVQTDSVGGWAGNERCTEIWVDVDYWAKIQILDAFWDIGSDQYTPMSNVEMAKIKTKSGGDLAGNGYALTATNVKIEGTLSSAVDIKVWWNTVDNFATATNVGTQTSPAIGTAYNIALTGAGNATGYLWYTISLPSQATGAYKVTISSITGSTADYIPLGTGKSTASRSVKPPTQTLEDWKDGAKNYNLNSSPPVIKQLLAKVETKKSSEGKPLTNSNVTILGTLAPSSIGKVQVWWKANTDDFGSATLVWEKTSGFPSNGTPFSLTNVANAGLNAGYLYYTIDIPSASARGSYALTINSVTGATTDNIPLPKTISYTYLTNPYAIQVCGECHAYPPKDGTRNGTTGAVQGTHSTHARFNPMKCRACHKDTTSGETVAAHRNEGIQLKSTLGKGGSYSGYTSWPQASSPTMRQCTSVVCHNGIAQTWGSGATMTCPQCHYNSSDLDDFTFDYFTSSAIPKIYTTEWKSRGHGKSTGTYDRTGNNAAKRVCTDCHDDGIGHGDPVKPYKTKGTGNMDVFCLNCHGTSAERGSFFLPYTAKTRDIRTHSQGVFSSVGYANITTWRVYQIKCIDCHDPHGDDNVAMIHKKPWTGGSDQKGRPAAFYNGYSTVRFKKYTGTDGMGMANSTKFYICEVCHTRTKFHKQGGTDGTTHFNGIKCPDCHTHGMGWAPYKGCVDCHAVARPYLYNVRQITGSGGDFVKLSRHVSDGTSTEIVTNYDCIVCHREGDYAKANAGTGFTSDTLHWDGATSTVRMVNLRNVDSRDTGWNWNKYTKNDAMRTGLDNFCMACHDSDGASNIAVNANDLSLDLAPAGDIALKPFNSNDAIRNGRDGLTARTRVVDVKSQFFNGTLTGASYNGNPSQHAVLGRRYWSKNASWTSATWTTQVYGNNSTANVTRETARLHCSDCHLSETNAHGAANAWHMLKNGTPGDNATDYDMGGKDINTDFASVVCYKCHSSAYYADVAQTTGTRWSHADDGNPWGSGNAGVYGTGPKSAKLGPTCLLCHSGGGFGHIHGRGSSTDATDSSWTYTAVGASRTKYRFMPGAYMYFKPGDAGNDTDWSTVSGNTTCYFPSKTTTWDGCAAHSGEKDGGGSTNYGRAVKY